MRIDSAPVSSRSSATEVIVRAVVAELHRRSLMEEGLRKRRRDARYDLAIQIPLAEHKPVGHFKPAAMAWGLDMSVSGLGLLCECPIQEGSHLWASLRGLGDERYVLPIRVIYCRHLLGNIHRIGAAFGTP